jgi:hypothetical protein
MRRFKAKHSLLTSCKGRKLPCRQAFRGSICTRESTCAVYGTDRSKVFPSMRSTFDRPPMHVADEILGGVDEVFFSRFFPFGIFHMCDGEIRFGSHARAICYTACCISDTYMPVGSGRLACAPLQLGIVTHATQAIGALWK